MKKSIPIVVALALMAPAQLHAASLADQIEAVNQAKKQEEANNQAAEDASRAAAAAQQAAQQEQTRRADEQRRSIQITAQRKVDAEKAAGAAAVQAKAQDAAADKKRDQDYQDKLRDMDLQRKQLEFEREKARVARENDFIDQDLKAQAASTDVVQSNADANRNVSQGLKDLMSKTGDARVQRAADH